jgi:uncharacterized delta-60 repeat protein
MRRLLTPLLLAALFLPAAADAAPRVTAAPGRLAVTYDADSRTHEQFGALAVGPDGTVFAGGAAGTSRRLAITAFGPDGRVVRGFGGRAPFVVREADALVRAADGSLFAVGRLSEGAPGIVRLDADGTFDRAYGVRPVPGLSQLGCLGCHGAALTPDGGLVVAGTGRGGRFAVAKLRADGTADPAFGVGGVAHPLPGPGGATELVVRPDGRLVARGFVGARAEEQRQIAVGLRANGTRDPAFAIVEPRGDAWSLRLDPAGRVLVATGNGTLAAIERFTAAGEPDPAWGSGGRVALGSVGIPTIVGTSSGVVVAAKAIRRPLVRLALDDGGRVGARSRTRLSFGGGQFEPAAGSVQVGTPDWGPQALALRPDGSLALAGAVFLSRAAEGDTFDASEAALAFVRARGGYARTPRSGRPRIRATVRRVPLATVLRRRSIALRFAPGRRGLAQVTVRAGGRVVARGGVPFWTNRATRASVPLTAAGRRRLARGSEPRLRVRIQRVDMAGNRRAATVAGALRR